MTSEPPILNYIAYADYLRDVEAITDAIRNGGEMPDYIVGIGRGGLAPAVYVSHGLDVPMLSVDHSSKVFGFSDELLDKLALLAAQGKRLLFIDDINDSGSTIAYLRGALAERGGTPANIRFAVLITNRRSRASVDVWSRMIDRTVDKDWFVFPWEAMASRTTLIQAAAEVPERLL